MGRGGFSLFLAFLCVLCDFAERIHVPQSEIRNSRREVVGTLSKARENLLSRLAFELIKIDFAMLVVGPFLKPEIFQRWLVGVGSIILIVFLAVGLIFEEG